MFKGSSSSSSSTGVGRENAHHLYSMTVWLNDCRQIRHVRQVRQPRHVSVRHVKQKLESILRERRPVPAGNRRVTAGTGRKPLSQDTLKLLFNMSNMSSNLSY